MQASLASEFPISAIYFLVSQSWWCRWRSALLCPEEHHCTLAGSTSEFRPLLSLHQLLLHSARLTWSEQLEYSHPCEYHGHVATVSSLDLVISKKKKKSKYVCKWYSESCVDWVHVTMKCKSILKINDSYSQKKSLSVPRWKECTIVQLPPSHWSPWRRSCCHLFAGAASTQSDTVLMSGSTRSWTFTRKFKAP